MTGLPFGLAEPLHIDEPFPTWKLVAAGFLLWLAFRVVRWLLQRLSDDRASRPQPAPLPAATTTGLGSIIDEIRQRTREDYRRGCHELAAALRRYLEQDHSASPAGPQPFPILTAREIAGRLGDTAVSRLFGLLAELQFRRRKPSKSDFEGACEIALEVAGRGDRR